MALIEREAAIEALEHAAEYYSRIDDCTEHSIRQCISTIKKIPAIDATPVVHGRWVKRADKGCWWCACSVCGAHIAYDGWGGNYFSPYCPNCAARMDGGENNA